MGIRNELEYEHLEYYRYKSNNSFLSLPIAKLEETVHIYDRWCFYRLS